MTTTAGIDLDPVASQGARLSRRHRVTIWDGSIRSGKTTTSLIAWVDRLLADPGPAVAIGYTQETVEENVVAWLKMAFGPAHIGYSRGTLHIAGHRVRVIGANSDQGRDRLAGATYRHAYVDEGSRVTEASWAMLHSRLSLPGASLIGTTNPDSPMHWLHDGWLAKARSHLHADGTLTETDSPLDLLRCSLTMTNNPSLSGEYVAQERAAHTGVFYRRMILGEWVAGQGVIWDAFDPDRHRTGPPPWLGLATPVLALDYGTRDAFFAVLGYVLAAEDAPDGHGRVFVADEWVYDAAAEGRQLADQQYARRLATWLGDRRPEWTYVDPSAASMKAELRLAGWTGVRDADNDVSDGLRRVGGLFATGRLTMSHRCPKLARAVSSHSWDDGPVEKPRHDGASHGGAALRYLIASTRRLWRSLPGLAAV